MRPISLTHDPHDRRQPHRAATRTARRLPRSGVNALQHKDQETFSRCSHPLSSSQTPHETPHPPWPPTPTPPGARPPHPANDETQRTRQPRKNQGRFSHGREPVRETTKPPGIRQQREPGAGPVPSGPNSAPPTTPTPGPAAHRRQDHRSKGRGAFTTFPPMSTHPAARTATRGCS